MPRSQWPFVMGSGQLFDNDLVRLLLRREADFFTAVKRPRSLMHLPTGLEAGHREGLKEPLPVGAS